MKRRILSVILIVCLLFGVMGTAPHAVEAKKKRIQLNYKKYTMKTGKTLKLKVKGTKKKVKWSSNRKKVATVSKKGVVKAVRAGKATITAKVGKKKYTCKIVVKKKTTSKTPPASTTQQDEKSIYDYNLDENIEITKQVMPDGSILIGMKNHVPYTIPRVEFMLEYTTYGDLYQYKEMDFCNLKPEETYYYALKGSSSDTEKDDLVNPDTVQITVTRTYYEYEYIQDVKDKMQISIFAAEADGTNSRPEGSLRYELANLGEKAITQFEFVIGFYDENGKLMKVDGRWNYDESNQYFTPNIIRGSYFEPPYDAAKKTYLPYASYRILYQNATYKELLVHAA